MNNRKKICIALLSIFTWNLSSMESSVNINILPAEAKLNIVVSVDAIINESKGFNEAIKKIFDYINTIKRLNRSFYHIANDKYVLSQIANK